MKYIAGKRIILGGSLRLFFTALLLVVAGSAAAATSPSLDASFPRANETHFHVFNAAAGEKMSMNLWGAKPALRLVMKQEDFPPGAWDRHEEGTEEVLMTVEATGAIAKYTVEDSSGFDDLDTAAMAFLTRPGTITPPLVNGRAAASHIRVMIVWSVKPQAEQPEVHT